VAVLAAAVCPPPVRADLSLLHLESLRLRAPVVYVGTVTSLRRIGGLEDLSRDTQGRMEAAVEITTMLRAPAATPPPESAPVRFDSRAPDPEGDGFYTLAAGESVLVFADTFEAAYPREMLHGAPAALADQVKELRDFVASMDAATMGLHGLTTATRLSEVQLYDRALAAMKSPGRPPHGRPGTKLQSLGRRLFGAPPPANPGRQKSKRPFERLEGPLRGNLGSLAR